MRSYREATRQTYQANRYVIKGWKWSSARNERTCAMCWAMDGTVHELDEPMEEHICGRCAMVPVTKSWHELGFDIDEMESGQAGTGIEAFEKLSNTEQLKILGPAKYAAWKENRFALSDLVGRKHDLQWGWTRYERSLVELIGEKDAKIYTRLALMGVAGNAGNYSADDLIRVAGLGLRELTPREIGNVVKYVAQSQFEPNGKQRVVKMLSGQVWNGKNLQTDEIIEPGIAHYLKHVVVRKEWPNGINYEQYNQSLKEIIENPKSGIFVSKYNESWQIGFIGESGKWQGEGGFSNILVEYKVKYGYWVTGFQPEDFEKQILDKRENVVWIRKLIGK